MLTLYYESMFFISLALMIVYMFIWHNHFDVHITLLFAVIPISNLGYVLLTHATTLESALIANQVVYLGGCFCIFLIMQTIFSLCNIRVSRYLRVGFFVVSLAVFLSVLTIGSSPIFYKTVSFQPSDIGGNPLVGKEYGFMHTVFTVMVIVYFVISLSVIIYSYVRKNQVSRKILFLLFLPVILSMASFFLGRRIFRHIELIPGAYTAALIVYLLIVWRISLYDVSCTGIDSLLEKGDTGFVSFDFSFNYLGSNETAQAVFPALKELTVDRPIQRDPEMAKTALPWLQAFREDESNNTFLYEKGDKTYQINISYMISGHRRRGYQFFIIDNTTDRQYIKLLDDFNQELQKEVTAKTAHIVEMHNQLILGMATMVESRDNSTGGHIRRTSVGVRLLIKEMQKSSVYYLTKDFCKNLIKAAPMHDLGKIAVDDAVLRKPGRFTPEEFEIMKSHAAEGARIVREILKDTDDTDFKRIAENVAHYHHERWDGSGYPEGLKGEEIPLEARIMAVADVYDALVSKRVYKESMSFEKADAIITEGMGRHFDPQLRDAYVSAREHLEAYYAGLG